MRVRCGAPAPKGIARDRVAADAARSSLQPHHAIYDVLARSHGVVGRSIMDAVLRWFAGVAVAMAPTLAAADEALRREAASLFGPLPAAADAGTPIAVLGRALFRDMRLSADGKTACASCHLPEDGGADRRRYSIDARGKPTSRNAPTVFDIAALPMLRWLGDRTTARAARPRARSRCAAPLRSARAAERLDACVLVGHAAGALSAAGTARRALNGRDARARTPRCAVRNAARSRCPTAAGSTRATRCRPAPPRR